MPRTYKHLQTQTQRGGNLDVCAWQMWKLSSIQAASTSPTQSSTRMPFQNRNTHAMRVVPCQGHCTAEILLTGTCAKNLPNTYRPRLKGEEFGCLCWANVEARQHPSSIHISHAKLYKNALSKSENACRASGSLPGHCTAEILLTGTCAKNLTSTYKPRLKGGEFGCLCWANAEAQQHPSSIHISYAKLRIAFALGTSYNFVTMPLQS